MTSSLKITSREELIATVPHVLGFVPVESMVCLALGDGPTARVDLPGSPEETGPWVRTLTDVYLKRHRTPRVALVAFGEHRQGCIEALGALGDALTHDEGSGPAVGPVLWVNGEHWTDLQDGSHGIVDPSARARVDAEFALRGRVMPAAGREGLATAMTGDPAGVAEHLSAASRRHGDLVVAGLNQEAAWVGERVERFHQDRVYLSDVDAARMLVAISETRIRDAAVFSMNRSTAPVASELWLDLVRRSPAPVRDTPVTLLAFSSFLEGRGAQAWVALDELSQSNRLTDLIAAALTHAVDPREWDKALPAAGTLIQHAALQQAALGEVPAPGSAQGFDPCRGAHEREARGTPGAGRHDPGTAGPDLGR